MLMRCVFAAVVLLSVAGAAAAQSTYQVPAGELVELADAPPTPLAYAGPGDWTMLVRMALMFTIADLSQPELKLGGYRFNPVTHEQTRAPYAVELSLLNAVTGERRTVTGLSSRLRARSPAWSPDGSRFAFTAGTDAGLTL